MQVLAAKMAPGVDDQFVLGLVLQQHFPGDDQEKVPARETRPVEDLILGQGDWLKERQYLAELFIAQVFKKKMLVQKAKDLVGIHVVFC